MESNRASVRRAKTEQGLDDGGLAGAVGTEQRYHFAVVGVQRDAIDRANIPEGDLEMVDVDGVTHALRT